MFDYTSTSPYELSISEGETVDVLEEDDGSGWIKVANKSREKGLVPASYVKVANDSGGKDLAPVKVSNVTARASVQYGASTCLHRVLVYQSPSFPPIHPLGYHLPWVISVVSSHSPRVVRLFGGG